MILSQDLEDGGRRIRSSSSVPVTKLKARLGYLRSCLTKKREINKRKEKVIFQSEVVMKEGSC